MYLDTNTINLSVSSYFPDEDPAQMIIKMMVNRKLIYILFIFYLSSATSSPFHKYRKKLCYLTSEKQKIKTVPNLEMTLYVV